MKMFVILAFVAIFAGIKGETDRCNIGDFVQCMPDSLKTFDIGNNLLPNEEALNKYCSPVTSYFQCVKSLIEECGTETLGFHPDVKDALLGGLKLANQICNDDSELRQAYLESTSCINANPQRFVQCAKNTSELSLKFVEYLEQETMPKSTLHKCTQIKLLGRCAIYEASKICDPDVLSSVMEVIEKIDDEVKDKMCPEDVLELYGEELFALVITHPEYIFEFMTEIEERRK